MRVCNGSISRVPWAWKIPRSINSLIRTLLERHKDIEIGFHLHNLAGVGLANVLAAIDAGASFVEGAICGTGGGIAMPHTIASVGNLATEDILHILERNGYRDRRP